MAGGGNSNCGTQFNILFYRVCRLQSHNVASWISMLWRMKHHTCGKTEFLCFHPKDKTPAPRLDTGCSEKAAPRTTAARSVASHNLFLMYVAHINMHCKINKKNNNKQKPLLRRRWPSLGQHSGKHPAQRVGMRANSQCSRRSKPWL